MLSGGASCLGSQSEKKMKMRPKDSYLNTRGGGVEDVLQIVWEEMTEMRTEMIQFIKFTQDMMQAVGVMV